MEKYTPPRGLDHRGQRRAPVRHFEETLGLEQMLGVQKDGGCHDHPVDIFHGEQSLVIVEGLNAGNHRFRLVAAATVNVGDGNQLGVGKLLS
jgi:hypothetical protein